MVMKMATKQTVGLAVDCTGFSMRELVAAGPRKYEEAIPMSRAIFSFIFVLSLWVYGCQLHAEDDYIIYQPDNPPWGSKDTGDGFIVTIVTEAFRRAEIPYSSVFVPWKRGQRQVMETHNGFMAPLTRIERRETEYQWVAPINISFLQLVTIDEALGQQEWQMLLQTPVVGRMESPAEFELKKLGFRYITIVENEKAAARMVHARRIPMWMQRGLPGNRAYWMAGGTVGDLHIIKRWTTPLQYLAASKEMPESIILKLRKSLTDMRTSGDIDKIKKRYFSYELNCEILLGCATDHKQ